MKSFSLKIKKKNGSALAYGLVIMFAVSVILTSTLQFVVAQMKFSMRTANREQALQLAEAGISYYRWYLAHETFTFGPSALYNFWNSGNVLGVGSGNIYDIEFPQGSPVGKYRLEVTKPVASSTVVIVKSTGWTNKDPNLKRVIQMRFRKPSLSEYAAVTNSNIRFGEGTTINGKIHSNAGIRFDGLANNVITSSLDSYADPDHCEGTFINNVCSLKKDEFAVHTHRRIPTGIYADWVSTESPLNGNVLVTRSDVFVAGRQFPSPIVSFDGFAEDNLFMKARAQIGVSGNGCSATGCYFDGSGINNYGRHIIFYANGTMSVRRVTNYNKDIYDEKDRVSYQGLGNIITEDEDTNYPIPDNGIIFVEDNAWIEGTINNKKVTVAAINFSASPREKANIYLGMDGALGNLLYTNFDGQDIIGLVAKDDIEIIKNSENNLTIYGALLAQNGRIGRKNYTCRTWKYETCTHWHGSICQNWESWDDVTPTVLTDDVQRCVPDAHPPTDNKNSITINGSLATKLRYGFAYAYSDGTFACGYVNRNLFFDNDLLYNPPPFYPTGNNKGYSLDLWQEL